MSTVVNNAIAPAAAPAAPTFSWATLFAALIPALAPVAGNLVNAGIAKVAPENPAAAMTAQQLLLDALTLTAQLIAAKAAKA